MNVGDKVTVPLTVDGETLELGGVVVQVTEPIGQALVQVEDGGRVRRVCLPFEALAARPAPSIQEEEAPGLFSEADDSGEE